MRLLKICVFAVWMVLAGQAAAGDGAAWYKEGEFWTGDTLTDVSWIGMNASLVIDWAQTRDIADNPDRFYETNDALGLHPTTKEVNKHFVYSLVQANTIHYFLPDDWKPYFSGLYIGRQYGFIKQNYEIGIEMRF